MLRKWNRSDTIKAPHHMHMLKGPELLAKIKELGEADRASVLRACGYVSTKKDGTERLNFTAFYEAVIEAKGVTLAPPTSKAAPKRGKALSFKVKASKTGVIPVTAGYSALIGVADGDYVIIEHVEGGLLLRKAASDEAAAPATAAPEAAAPVVVTPAAEPAVLTYDSAPAKELVGAGAERTPF